MATGDDQTEKPLSDLQQRFVEEYLVDQNATQAAIRAGYSAKTAKEQASRLLTKVNVSAALKIEIGERTERLKFTVDDMARQLDEDREFARQCKAAAAAVTASMGKAKLMGMLTDKIEHSGEIATVATVSHFWKKPDAGQS